MKRLLPLALLLAAPLLARAQNGALRLPSIGESLREMDRLRRFHEGLPQTLVVPERAGQNLVAWYDFEWHHYDIPSPSGGKGGIRLYYYRREAPIAERALPAVRSAYLRLVDQFHYTPTRQIPYFLYSSKREFQTTNIFQVGEGVLGVTSPQDLKMSLPYFGDHEKFREVSTHEMVHQFTVQKLLEIAGADQLASIGSIPLWFIEGIAEWYSKGGMDTQTDMFLRDLVWNPDPARGYAVPSFFEDRYRGYIATYKVGQTRVEFIAETYGKEKIQALLEGAFVGGDARPAGGGAGGPVVGGGFGSLVRRVLNEPPEQVEVRWRTWLKRRYYAEYTRVRQDLPQVREVAELPAEPDAFAASPDGQVVVFRGLDRERGRVRIYLFDIRYPRGAIEVASDQQPGFETFHPIEQNAVAISAGHLAFLAQDGASDSLYVVPFRHEPGQGTRPPRLQLGPRKKLPLRHPAGLRLIELADPAFSPDGKSIAFVGLTDLGQRDIYVVSAEGGTARQLTDDDASERDLAWGKEGITFASDGTDHGRTNLFRIPEGGGPSVRLTTEAVNDRSPCLQADGSVVFARDQGGKVDLYRLRDGQVRRLSDFATGLSAPQVAPGGRGLYASTFYRGNFRIVELPRAAYLEDPAVAVPAAAGPALPVPREPIPESTPLYDAAALRNWHVDGFSILGGGGGGFVVGTASALFSDLLRDRALFLNIAVLGSFDFTQALVLYEDRGTRSSWVFGGYHFVNQQFDRTNPYLGYYQRDFGLGAVLRYPLNRYQRVELELAGGGVQRFCLTDFTNQVLPFYCNAAQYPPTAETAAEWDKANGGVSPVLGPVLRYGYDNVRFDPYTGPIAGGSFIYELGATILPTRQASAGFSRFDASYWLQIVGRANIMFRLAAGGSFASNAQGWNWARTWWLSASDNLRGFYEGDTQFLIGLYYYVSNLELQVPLDPIFRLFLFDNIEGVAALDFGGVASQTKDSTYSYVDANGNPVSTILPGIWGARTLTGVLGFNVLLGPFLLRVHFGHPFDIGGLDTPALHFGQRWVTNITLRYALF